MNSQKIRWQNVILAYSSWELQNFIQQLFFSCWKALQHSRQVSGNQELHMVPKGILVKVLLFVEQLQSNLLAITFIF